MLPQVLLMSGNGKDSAGLGLATPCDLAARHHASTALAIDTDNMSWIECQTH